MCTDARSEQTVHKRVHEYFTAQAQVVAHSGKSYVAQSNNSRSEAGVCVVIARSVSTRPPALCNKSLCNLTRANHDECAQHAPADVQTLATPGVQVATTNNERLEIYKHVNKITS